MTITDNIRQLSLFLKDIIGYNEDPRGTLERMSMKAQKEEYPITSEKIQNLLTGLSSEMTTNYAISAGKKAINNAVVSLLTDVVDGVTKRYKNIKLYTQELTDAMHSLDEVYNDGMIQNRWLSIKGSLLYQRYFTERLNRDFLQEVNGVVYGSDIVLTIEKIIVIMKSYLNRVNEESLIKDLVDTNKNTKALLGLTSDMKSLVCFLPDTVDLSKLPKSMEPLKFEVPVYNKSQTGKILKEIALTVPDIDEANNSIDILGGMESLLPMFDSSYGKLSLNVKDVKNVLIDGYHKDTIEVVTKIKETLIELVQQYLDRLLIDEDFPERVVNYLNVLIRVADIDNSVTSKTNDICSQLAKTISIYISLYNLYYSMMMHSLTAEPDEIKK